MASSAEHRSIFKLQGGTGKHVDGDVLDPLQCRPFQALVQLSPPPRDPGAQGSLKVLPGFHAASAHFFEVSGLPPPAGGFTPLTEHDHPDLIDEELWTPVARLPARWRDKHSRGELPAPSAAPSARGRAGVVKALRGLAAELRALEGAPLQPGDYVIWDTRLPHTTGDPDALCGHERPRQVFYCAYTLAAECVALSAEQRSCRATGLHTSWAPTAQRHDEATASYVPAPLSELGRALYGYGDGWAGRGGAGGGREARAARRRAEQAHPQGLGRGGGGEGGGASERVGVDEEGGAAGSLPEGWRAELRKAASRSYHVFHGPGGLRAVSAPDAWRKHRLSQPLATREGVPGGSGGGSGGGAEDAAEAGGGGAGSVLTAAHVSFFLRFGYVVVEGAVPEELTAAIATDVREHLLRRHGIDLDDAVRTLTLPRLQRAFSPDGSGMLEVYWLRSMEEVRQLPALHDVTRTLFERSWGAAARGFRRSRSSGMVAQPDLGLYIDRTSVRLPAAALQPLLRRDGPVASASAASTGFKIRVPTGGAATNGGGRGRDGGGRGRGGDVYSVKMLLGHRDGARGGKEYLVSWQGYPGEDTWEPAEHILDKGVISAYDARRAGGGAAAAPLSGGAHAAGTTRAPPLVRLELALDPRSGRVGASVRAVAHSAAATPRKRKAAEACGRRTRPAADQPPQPAAAAHAVWPFEHAPPPGPAAKVQQAAVATGTLDWRQPAVALPPPLQPPQQWQWPNPQPQPLAVVVATPISLPFSLPTVTTDGVAVLPIGHVIPAGWPAKAV